MASIIGKQFGGRRYYYLAESARVEGKPRITGQRYLGTAEGIAAAVAGEQQPPRSSEHLRFGDVAAVWSTLCRMDFVRTVDRVAPGRGRDLALAVLYRVTGAGSDTDHWLARTATARVLGRDADTEALDDTTFWRRMRRVSTDRLAGIEEALAARLLEQLGEPDPVTLALDVPAFATYTAGDTATLAGLSVLVTRDGAVPLVSHCYQRDGSGSEPFERVMCRLRGRLGSERAPTTVFDADQYAELEADAPFVGAVPLREHGDLLSRPSSARSDVARFTGLSALDTRATIAGRSRRVVLTHSERLHAAQSRAFTKSLGTATRRLAGLARSPVGGTTERELRTELGRITQDRWVDRVLSVRLHGNRLDWRVDEAARARLDEDYFGKQLLVTAHEDWPVADVVTAYRARYHLEATFRMLDEQSSRAPAPRWSWTPHRMAVHALVSVLAAGVAHLMRHRADRAGIDLSVRELIATLGGIGETMLRYPSTGGRPRTRRLLTERDHTQQALFELFGLQAYAPPAP